ncbi:hypothetical protein [Oxobacter pfennigii]|uniref:hypothetical protein n=1 Tax=Oxobacter pfennigii TaxID=36849 RepID=UPI001FA786A0|nr:hypothetical protein [Oxobacter pfennigii]
MDKLTPVTSGAGILPLSVAAGGVSFSDAGVTSAVCSVLGAGDSFTAADGKLGGIVRTPITSISRLAAISIAGKILLPLPADGILSLMDMPPVCLIRLLCAVFSCWPTYLVLGVVFTSDR